MGFAEPQTREAAIGMAFHGAMEAYFISTDREKQLADPSMIGSEFLTLLKKYKYLLTDRDYATYSLWPTELMPGYIESAMPGWWPDGRVELKVDSAPIADWGTSKPILLTGRLDRLEYRPDGLVIVDFKSGKSDDPNHFKKPSLDNEKLIYGGKYWQQAVFYVLLMENSPIYGNRPIDKVRFEFIRPAKSEKVVINTVTITEDDKALLKQQIVEAWNAIQNGEFLPRIWQELADAELLTTEALQERIRQFVPEVSAQPAD
jgi:hypothetical protein